MAKRAYVIPTLYLSCYVTTLRIYIFKSESDRIQEHFIIIKIGYGIILIIFSPQYFFREGFSDWGRAFFT